MADKSQLAYKNKVISGLYDDVDTISEELVDNNYPEVGVAVKSLEQKLKQLKTDIANDEV